MTLQKYEPQKVNGILLLDKPKDISSNTALQIVKRIFKAKKAGHTGSLDVLAEGMLPICFGEATKFSQYLLDSDKTYFTIAELGKTTLSGDAEGEFISQASIADVTKEKIQIALEKFRGEIEQIPPMYSALKFQGKPLYHFARKGIEIERKLRKVFIYNLQLINYQDGQLTLRVHCSKGTYIRTLVEDIGKTLGCGAYVQKLRRISVGQYQEEQMVSLEKLKTSVKEDLNHYLLPLTTALSQYQKLQLSEEQVLALIRGQEVRLNIREEPTCVQLYTPENQFLGLGDISTEGHLKVCRLVDTLFLRKV